MKPVKWLLGLALSVPIVVSAAPNPIQFRGYLLTDWYSVESHDSTDHQKLYETLSFRLEHSGVNSFGLVTHLRWQGDSVDDFSKSSLLQAHNLYLRFNHADKLDLRVGRQWLAEGVGFGTFDALRVNLAPQSKVNFTVWGGVAAPDTREFEVQKTDSAIAYGAAVRTRVTDKFNVLASYLYQEMGGLKYRHRVGLSGNLVLSPTLTGTALAHFNLGGASPIHRLRALLRYSGVKKVRLSVEGAVGTPQLPIDTPFDNVEMPLFALARVNGSYQVSPTYWVGLRVQTLLTSPTPNTTLGLTLEGLWGQIGYRQRFGDFGDESGLFGSAQYRLTNALQIYGSGDFSHYKFEGMDRCRRPGFRPGGISPVAGQAFADRRFHSSFEKPAI